MNNNEFKIIFKKRLYVFTLKLLKFLKQLPQNQINEVIIKQLIRSCTSIIANYVEAQAAGSNKDFINFLRHALKSANESKLWTTLLKDTNANQKAEKYKWFVNELIEISNILASSIITTNKKINNKF